MPDPDLDPVKLFRKNAPLMAVTLVEAASLDEALDYALNLCRQKAPCEILIREDGKAYGPESENGLPTSLQKVLAAPGLAKCDMAAYARLHAKAQAAGVLCIKENLRQYSGGYDVGLAFARLGIADSVTCLVESSDEDVRLSTMTCEICILLLPRSQVITHLEEAAPVLREMLAGPGFAALITGPSRTADIERVTTLGAHGPVELHIVLLEA